MESLRVVLPFLLLNALVADDISNTYIDQSFDHDKYARDANILDLDTDIGIHERSRRQATSPAEEEYYVTQCGYDNQQQPDGPSIQVLGKALQIQGAGLAVSYFGIRECRVVVRADGIMDVSYLHIRQDFPNIYWGWKNSSYTGGCSMTLVL